MELSFKRCFNFAPAVIAILTYRLIPRLVRTDPRPLTVQVTHKSIKYIGICVEYSMKLASNEVDLSSESTLNPNLGYSHVRKVKSDQKFEKYRKTA